MLYKFKSAFYYGKDFCEDTAENLKETLITAVDCTKLHYRIVSQRNELNNLYAILGRTLLKGAEDEDNAKKEERINSLIEKITLKEDILFGLVEQYRIVSGKVICPDCGKFMNDKYSFCPWCGNLVKDFPVDDVESDVTVEDLADVREIDEL